MALATKKKREVRKSLRQPGWITLEGGFAARQCVVLSPILRPRSIRNLFLARLQSPQTQSWKA